MSGRYFQERFQGVFCVAMGLIFLNLLLLTASAWWCISLWLYYIQFYIINRGIPNSSCAAHKEKSCGYEDLSCRISIFKAIPDRQGASPSAHTVRAINSYVQQMGPRDEIVLAVSEKDEVAWSDCMKAWCLELAAKGSGRYGDSRLRLVRRGQCKDSNAAVSFLNPKVTCLYGMAEHARGTFWLWSDADVVAPQGIVEAALIHLQTDEQRKYAAITIPYHVCGVESAPGILDLLYVNAELLPGLRLIANTAGSADFALGAFTLFREKDFRRRAYWDRIGGSLADDFELGQALRPVALRGDLLVEIAAEEPDWSSALLHYYRWQKNIRWCQPAGFAAQLLITPVAACLAVLAGLIAWSFFLPHTSTGISALAHAYSAGELTLQLILLESAWALLLCRAAGCRLGWMAALAPVWSVVRAIVWWAVWLPIPVRWGRTWWSSPRKIM